MIKHSDWTGEGVEIETHYWRRRNDGRVQWYVRPRACKLREGQRGFCFVRANQGDQIVLTSYARMDAANIDFKGVT